VEIVKEFAEPSLAVLEPGVLRQLKMEMEAWSEPVMAPDVDGLAEFCVEHFEWGEDVVRMKMNGILGQALRVRRLRVEAHRVAMRGEVEVRVRKEEVRALERKEELFKDAKAGGGVGGERKKKNQQKEEQEEDEEDQSDCEVDLKEGKEGKKTLGKGGKKGAEASQSSKITDFFSAMKKKDQGVDELAGDKGISPHKTQEQSPSAVSVSSLIPDSDSEEAAPPPPPKTPVLNSSLCHFAAETPRLQSRKIQDLDDGDDNSKDEYIDTALIEEITRRRISKFGVDELRVKWSTAAMEADRYNPSPKESSQDNDSDNEIKTVDPTQGTPKKQKRLSLEGADSGVGSFTPKKAPKRKFVTQFEDSPTTPKATSTSQRQSTTTPSSTTGAACSQSTIENSQDWNSDDDWAEWREEQQSQKQEQEELDTLQKQKKKAESDELEWVESSLVRVAAPRKYAEFCVLEAMKKAKKDGLLSKSASLAGTPSGRKVKASGATKKKGRGEGVDAGLVVKGKAYSTVATPRAAQTLSNFGMESWLNSPSSSVSSTPSKHATYGSLVGGYTDRGFGAFGVGCNSNNDDRAMIDGLTSSSSFGFIDGSDDTYFECVEPYEFGDSD
jgi:hypothetical protein